MPAFRKKPVVIIARRLTTENQEELADWCNGKLRGTRLPVADRIIQIETLEGEMDANVGDWIIQGVKGEFYPCRNDIFEITYERPSNMPNKQLVEDLKAARAVIETPDKWAKGYYAYDAKGNWTDADNPEACKFCGIGAVQKVTDGEWGDRARVVEKFLTEVIRSDTFLYFPKFNDDPDTTHADVLAAFDRAIAAAEAL